MVTHGALPHTILAPEQAETAKTGAEVDSDALLQASRRVDWRFLLPDPDLGRVAYIGSARGTLVESLTLFSTSLTLIERGARLDAGVDPGRYDIVVVSDPTIATLRRAAALLRSGGWLYVEAYSPFSRPRRLSRSEPLHFVRDYVTVLHRLGLVEVEAYWHWPNFEACTKIIPLDKHPALLQVLAPRQTGVRLKALLGRWLVRSGVLALVIPCFSIVAHSCANREAKVA